MANDSARGTLGVREQCARMRLAQRQFKTRVRGGLLTAVGDIQPTPLSPAYRVKIEYRAGEPPQVHVLSPKLVPREEGGCLPHVYPGDRLCLFLPGAGEWLPSMSLAHVLVPWISEWLYFYEVWHATGDWLGGGVEPGVTSPVRRAMRGEDHDRNRM
jgi:hypothetical protein